MTKRKCDATLRSAPRSDRRRREPFRDRARSAPSCWLPLDPPSGAAFAIPLSGLWEDGASIVRGKTPALEVRTSPVGDFAAPLHRETGRAKLPTRVQKGGPPKPSPMHAQSPIRCQLIGKIANPYTQEPQTVSKDSTSDKSRKGTHDRPPSIDAPELAQAEAVHR